MFLPIDEEAKNCSIPWRREEQEKGEKAFVESAL